MTRPRCVLAYSGGLDTSVSIRWLMEERGYDVVTFTADLGEAPDLAAIRAKALRSGAVTAHTADLRRMFVERFAFPNLTAGALYEQQYPLATALARPLMAKVLVEIAHREGAVAVAHGCTGKGNDQVRFDVAVAALDPSLLVVAPVREAQMGRPDAMRYAAEHGIEVPVTAAQPYSIDANLWGRSIETGVLEDPWVEPPRDAFLWTADPAETPAEGTVVTVAFERGVPVALDGRRLAADLLVAELNLVGGRHGVGRIDHVENRLVGIKCRELYEAPAAVILHAAHAALEALTLSRDTAQFKRTVAEVWSRLVYDGLWFGSLREALSSFVDTTQEQVRGEVRVRLQQGALRVVGRRSEASLYRHDLATYDRAGDSFDHTAARGFIRLFGLPLRTQSAIHGLRGEAARPLLDECSVSTEGGHDG